MPANPKTPAPHEKGIFQANNNNIYSYIYIYIGGPIYRRPQFLTKLNLVPLE